MNAKKWLALLLALVMVFSLAACGKDKADNEDGGKTLEAATDYTDNWICIRMESEGYAMSIKDMAEMDEGETSMNIASDGKLTMRDGDAITGTWVEAGTGIEFTPDDPDALGAEKLSLTHDAAADTLAFDFDGVTMVFARKGSEAETESRNTNYFSLDDALEGLGDSEEYPQVTLAVGTPSTTTFTGETLSAKVYAEFTAQKPGDYTFWAEGDQDTYATLYSDAEHTNTLAAGDDENGSNFVITYNLGKAETVYLEAGIYFTNIGDLVLNVDLADRASVSAGGADAAPTDNGEAVPADNGGAAVAASANLPEGFVAVALNQPAVATMADSWDYAHGMFVADQAGDYTFTAQANADVSFYIYGNADCLSNQLGSVDNNYDAAAETLTLTLQTGQTVYLESLYYGNTYPAEVTFTAALAGNQAAVAAPTPTPAAPAASSVPIPEGFMVVTLDTPTTTIQEDFFDDAHGMFTAGQAGDYTFTAQADADVSFYIYSDAECYDVRLGYADDHYDAVAETITLTLQAGQTVYLEACYYGENFPANVTFNTTMGGQTTAAVGTSGDSVLTLGAPLVLTTSSSNLCAYASFTAPSAGTYLFTATSTEDCTLFLYGDGMENYGFADEYYAGTAEFLSLTLTAGQNVYLEIGTLYNTGTVVVAVSSN